MHSLNDPMINFLIRYGVSIDEIPAIFRLLSEKIHSQPVMASDEIELAFSPHFSK